jgi:hypothetical protein
MEPILLQASVGGLAPHASDAAETVIGALDVPTGVLLVHSTRPVKRGTLEVRQLGCAVATNNPATDDRDLLFQESDFRDAIGDYYSFAGRGLLVLADPVRKHDPSSKIEPDGLDERGRRYRFANDISNGQIAVVVMCWAALRQQAFARQLTAFDDFADLDVFSVGYAAAGSVGDGKTQIELAGGLITIGTDGWPIEPGRRIA